MIKPGFKYKIFHPKEVAGRTVFDICNYNKSKPDEKAYISLMTEKMEIKTGEEIEIVSIAGLDPKTYTNKNGEKKLQVTLYATVRKIGQNTPVPQNDSNGYFPDQETGYYPDVDFNTGPLLDLDSDDLPF